MKWPHQSQIQISHNIYVNDFVWYSQARTNFTPTNLDKFYNEDSTPKPKPNLDIIQIEEII